MTRIELRQEIEGAKESVLDIIGPLGDMPETARVVRIHTLLSAAVDLLRQAQSATVLATELEGR